MTLSKAFSDGAPLLAERTNWHSLGDRFSGEHLQLQTEDFVWAGVLIVFFGGLIGLLKWLAHWDKVRRTRPNPKRLFTELCDAHGLQHEERALLLELASLKKVPRAVELFVRPDLFIEGSPSLLRLRDQLFSSAS